MQLSICNPIVCVRVSLKHSSFLVCKRSKESEVLSNERTLVLFKFRLSVMNRTSYKLLFKFNKNASFKVCCVVAFE